MNFTIDAGRLWDSLTVTARIGATGRGGLCRLALGEADREVRDWLRQAVEAIGCTVTVDEVGNMFALYPGRRPDLAPIAIGSHLDTQPTGGRFDGILGVLGGLEMLRTLHDRGHVTEAPLVLVDWANEEGARFAPAMLGSGVHAGVFDVAYAHGRTDADGVTFGAALERIGCRGLAGAGAFRLGALFELHIEQGPILEAEGQVIGIVTGVQGARWYDVRLTGASAHTGATPMAMRRNALLGAACLIEAVEAIAQDHAPGALAAVGRIECRPNSRNVVPGVVDLTVDLRHPDDRVLERMETALMTVIADAAASAGLDHGVDRIWDSPSVRFDPDCIAAVRAGAADAGFAGREIVSGAGHDAVYVARVAPTAMIFVPCRGGISHNEAESATPEHCAAGAQVLLNAVLRYDTRSHGGSPP
ncbi:MAG: M20 family metallo-hydrolase [Zavarzinia sp.]|nr:M20 family metallo-hydrolase [Zavarzinia sp.]